MNGDFLYSNTRPIAGYYLILQFSPFGLGYANRERVNGYGNRILRVICNTEIP